MNGDYISVIGSINYDLIIKQERLPKLGETYTANEIHYEAGGKGANQAVQASKLGINTYMFGGLGYDDFGKFLYKQLESYGVNVEKVQFFDTNTGMGIVNSLPDGSVYATILTGANFCVDKKYIDNNIDIILGSKILILQLEIPTEVVSYIIDIANENSIYTILNAAPAKPLDSSILAKVDSLILNESEASFYANEEIFNEESALNNIESIRKLGCEEVIVTLGSKGSILFSADTHFYIEPEVVSNVIETTGAGDSYVGAFAYGKFNDWDSIRCCKFASKVAAKTVTKIGAQTSMPYIEEL